MHHASAAQLHALRGEAAAAHRHLDRAEACIEHGLPGEFETPFRSAAAALALAERDPGAAREHAATALTAPAEPLYIPVLLWLGVRAEADAAEAARAHRRPGRPHARRRAARRVPRRRRGRTRLPRARAGRARAPGGQAGRRLVARCGRPLRRARGAVPRRLRAAARGGGAAHARRRPADGDRASGAAHATAVELAARPLREDVEALARRARVSPLPAPPAPDAQRPRTGC